MFIDAGQNFRIFCDYESRSIRIAKNIFPSQFKPQYTETTAFTDEKEWYQSSYAKDINIESIQEDIAWFWADMELTSNNTPPPVEDPSLGTSR